ncbi:MAG: hypothetical protein ACYC7D_03175 [Nitrososphaerales archaeon]
MKSLTRTKLIAIIAFALALSSVFIAVYSVVTSSNHALTTSSTTTPSITGTPITISSAPSLTLLLNVVNSHWNSQVGLVAVGAQGPASLGSTEYNANANYVLGYALSGIDNSLSRQILKTLRDHASWNYTNCRREALLGVSISPFRSTPPPPYHDPNVAFSEQPIGNVNTVSGNATIILDNYCYGPVANQSEIASSFEDSLFAAFDAWANGNLTGAHTLLMQAASFWDGSGFQGHGEQYRTRDLGYYAYAIRAIGYAPSQGPTLVTLGRYLYLLQGPDGSFSNQYSNSDLDLKNQQNSATDVETILSVFLAFNPSIALPNGTSIT